MYSMKLSFSDFVDWLDNEVQEGRLTQADIANTGLVSRSAVSLLFSRTTKSLSFEMCEAIAIASQVPLEEIYRRAGLLPPALTKDKDVQDIIDEVRTMPKQDADEVLAYVRMLKNLRKNNGK